MRSKHKIYDHVGRNLDWFLDAYVGLDEYEKDVVQQYVQDNSDHASYDQWVKRLIDAKVMERLLNDAGALADSSRDIETFPYTFLASRLKNGPGTESLDAELHKIKRRRERGAGAEEDEEISKRLAIVNQVEAKKSALEHFESLSGHVVREDPPEYKLVTSLGDRLRSGPGHRQVVPRDRAPQPPVSKRVRRVVGKIVQPIFVAVVVVSVLQVASYLNDSPIDRRAHLKDADVAWAERGLATRGFVRGSEIEIYEDYVLISKYASGARKSVFGLFPSYHADMLHQAKFLMDMANQRLEKNTSPPGAALILYAKISFLLGDIDSMIPALKKAATMDGPSGTEARKIMIDLDEANLMQYP
ncbi:MAG: hypothetical protein E2O84_06725 [Bacteroidetes bacterium]|nr:MAG: hypothetical protein E2O84_06725 [Bacteroidota bacterium]